LLLVIGLIAGTFLSAFKTGNAGLGIPESMVLIIIFALSIVYFFPVFFLFRFSNHTANAVHSLNKEELRKAFRNLKLYFMYLGVLLIIIMIMYVAALIFTGTSLGFLKGLE
jgi:sterol desaturase/sphingolipid hydroxylase (fatty acid hydroxylase superfamily)